ncbi:BGP_1a_G0009150.mRNA.1.CDS.1 [Saccharomyces cerevisiae]|nr:BGP_1a_G0009150.mRNA.1.CDS.1 [Saccharomyces cerevisiae]CAI7069385.1 BGP_1a_G0009150.mRNA.1.CDS.1 [Saccharomyces cerevisiae]
MEGFFRIPLKRANLHGMLKAAISKIKANFTAYGAPRINIEDFNIVKEGKAEILFPKRETVFYNPIQQFNRDLSVTCIKAWDNLYGEECGQKRNNKKSKKKRCAETNDDSSKRQKMGNGSPKEAVGNSNRNEPYINILEALSATGLRAIRYAHEIPHVREVIANDLLPEAVESIKRNVEYNSVENIVKPNLDDANVLMYRNKATNNKFHVIDLDPYGTVTPFVDAAIQSIEEGGLMLVTCTDLSVLAGNGYPEKCFALYGGANMVSHESTHESALRLVLNLLKQTAAKYKKTVEPLLSLSIDFYVRVFVKVKTSPIEVKNVMSSTMTTYHCSRCGSYHNQPLGRISQREGRNNKTFTKYSVAQGPPVDTKCKFCEGTYHLAGPMYAGPLHNKEFIEEVLRINKEEHRDQDDTYGTRKRIEGMLSLAKNELSDSPFYFSPNHIASVIKLQVPPLKKVVAGLGSLGFECSLTHAQPSSLKTNAPWDAIWYVMQKCDDEKKDLSKMNPNTTGYKILSAMPRWLSGTVKSEYDSKLSFAPNEQSGNIEKLRKLKIVRYQENPTKNWGPKARPNTS